MLSSVFVKDCLATVGLALIIKTNMHVLIVYDVFQRTNNYIKDWTQLVFTKILHFDRELNKMLLLKWLWFTFTWSFGISPGECRCQEKMFTHVEGRLGNFFSFINVKKNSTSKTICDYCCIHILVN